MDVPEALDRISALLGSDDPATTNTSMRLPVRLRDAAALAVRELGTAASTTDLVTSALESILEGVLMEAVLEEHFQRYPQARPDLGDLAIAAAQLDGHPLADRPERLRQAAAEIVRARPAAAPEDVVLWAEAQEYSAA